MADDIVTRLRRRSFTYPDGEVLADDLALQAADEIERLRSALALACGELSGYGPHTNSSPDHLMQELLEEARRD